MFVLAAALYAGYSIERLYELTKIDHWFLHKFQNIISCHQNMQKLKAPAALQKDVMLEAKKLGFSDKQIARCCERYVARHE